jgi:xanthine dehydrogenase accessory factor
MPQFYDQLVAALAEGQPFALGIISGIKGSSPQKKGAKALFFSDGRIVGTLGGGCLEAEIQDRARRSLLTKQPATFDLVLDHDFGWDDGLICGGKVCGVILPRAAEVADLWRELAQRETTRTWGVAEDFSIGWADQVEEDGWHYRETVSPPCGLWIAGSGHVAQAVAPMALQLDFEVTVFDDRPALASRQYFPEGTQFRVGAWEQLLETSLPAKPTFGLVVTRGHQRDALVLAKWIHEPFAFLGMIGSRRKARLIFTQFVEDKIATEEELAKVVCPVGLDIDSRTVPEIAVSIVAQLIQERARILRESSEPVPTSAKAPVAKTVITPAVA